MEEQGMARSYRLSATDLMALAGVPRAYEIFDETLGGEVKTELESFTGGRVSRREAHTLNQIRHLKRYVALAPLHGVEDFFCFIGYNLRSSDVYPKAIVSLEARPGAVGRETSISAMKSISHNEDWNSYSDNPSGWAGVRRSRSLTVLLSEEDHVAAVQSFFIESINQLREELTEFKKTHPDLLWSGE